MSQKSAAVERGIRVRPRRSVIASQVLAVSLASIASNLSAQAKVFSACYVPLTGTVYRIKEADIRQTCASTSHVEFTWTDGAGAVRIGGAAAGDLSGLFPNPTVAALLGRALATTPPAAGQVLTFNGTVWVPMTPSGAGGATSDHGALSGLADDDHPQYVLVNGVRNATNGFAVAGTLGTGAIPASGAGVRLMWYPGKAAFRAGGVSVNQWDDATVGQFSLASGFETMATGFASTAIGRSASATGFVSTAMGFDTEASGDRAVAMGFETVASGVASTAMGEGTRAEAHASTAMGLNTRATVQASTATGINTLANGQASTAMGLNTIAAGQAAVAMGANVTAGEGSFIFGDRSTDNHLSFGGQPNLFIVRAAGGTRFYSASDLSSGVFLSPGGGAWGTLSDVNRKHHFREEDAENALTRVAAMPIRSWSYKSQDPSIRHLGPTAQDFYAAFRLGESDTTITTTDIDGVTLLAVKGLEQRSGAQSRAIDAIRAENVLLREKLRELAALHAELVDLRARFERMERERNER